MNRNIFQLLTPKTTEKSVCTTDIGDNYMSTVGMGEERVLMPMMATSDGRFFEWEEKMVQYLAWDYFCSTMHIWKGKHFIGIEKQLCKNPQRNGHCLLIETCLKSYHLMAYQLGIGPKPISYQPKFWKKQVGIEEGEGIHSVNKVKSKEKYREVYGSIAFNKLLSEFDGKVDDVCEATLLRDYMLRIYDELVADGDRFPSSHDGHMNGQKFIPAEERMLPLIN